MTQRRSMLSLSVYFASFVGLGLSVSCLGPTLPSLAAVTGTSLAQIGILLFARSLGGMIGSLCAGPAVDHGLGRATIVGSMIVMSASMAIVPFSHSWIPMAIIFLALGVGHGALNVAANTLIVWRYPDKAHSFLSMLHFCFGLGSVVAPLLVAWLLPLGGNGLLVYVLLAAALAPLVLWLATSAVPTAQREKRVIQAPITSRAAFWWSVLLFALFVGAETTMGSWLYSYAEQGIAFSPATAAYLVSVFWGAFTFGRLLTVFGSGVMRPSTYVSGGLAASAVLAAGFVVFRGGGLFLWIVVAGLGLSMAAVFPQAFAFVSESLGITGRRTAWLLLGGSFGGMLMPWLAGILLDSISAQAMPIIVSLAMAVALVVFTAIQRMSQATSPTS